ncbi:hypothetical protein [Bacillus sp. AK128]
MNTFLLIISFILHAISFFIIILMYYRLEQTREIERKQGNLLKDMEDVLSSYILEMKEENEIFLQKVKNDNPTLKSSESKAKKNVKKDPVIQSTINTIESQISNEDLSVLLPNYGEEIEQPVSIKKTQQKDENIQSLPIGQQAKLLHKKGLTVEEIAKQLDKGVTEIELFLKFN